MSDACGANQGEFAPSGALRSTTHPWGGEEIA
jgi:hypothetical protein